MKSQQQQQEQQQEKEDEQQQQEPSSRASEIMMPPPPVPPPESATDKGSDQYHHQMNLNLRAAIALNNMGVSLLERGSCKSARKTFQDSLVVMIMVQRNMRLTTENNSSHILDNNRDNEAVQAKVQRASVRLATKCIPKKSSTRTAAAAAAAAGSKRGGCITNFVDIVALDDTDIAAIRSAIRYGPSVSMAFPIRCTFLEYHHHHHQQQQQQSRKNSSNVVQLQYYTAMIRYNHGLAHLLAYDHHATASAATAAAALAATATSSVSVSSSSPKKLLSHAFRHLSHAYSLLLPNIQASLKDKRKPQQQQQQPENDSSISGDDEEPVQHHDAAATRIDEEDDATADNAADDDDDDDDDNDAPQFFSNLLLLALTLMSLHTFFRHKGSKREGEANQVLDSLLNLENAIRDHDVMETCSSSSSSSSDAAARDDGHDDNGISSRYSSSSCTSVALLCDLVHGASAA